MSIIKRVKEELAKHNNQPSAPPLNQPSKPAEQPLFLTKGNCYVAIRRTGRRIALLFSTIAGYRIVFFTNLNGGHRITNHPIFRAATREDVPSLVLQTVKEHPCFEATPLKRLLQKEGLI